MSKGLIHDCIGAVLFPNATLEGIFAVVQDHAGYKLFYKLLVIDSKSLGADGADYRFSLLMLNKSLFAKRVLVSEWKDRYIWVDDRQWYSISYSTRVEEIEGYGSHGERQAAPGRGQRLYLAAAGFSRFKQRDRGVYLELEAIALSRDIPAALRWLINPIVRRVSRRSVFTSLIKTRAAVSSAVSASNTYSRPAARHDRLFVPGELHSLSDRR